MTLPVYTEGWISASGSGPGPSWSFQGGSATSQIDLGAYWGNIFLGNGLQQILLPAVAGAGGGPGDTSSPPCTSGIGAGLTGGAAVDLGIGYTGATANGSLSAGGFWNPQTGASGGAVASGSAMANFGSHTVGAPSQAPLGNNASVFGAFAGTGGGVFFTNAGSAQQLASTQGTIGIDLGFGPALSIEWSGGPGVGSVSITGGFGYGAAVRVTNTASKGTGQKCH